jgi:GIY-YIG catalytic domain/NUMOD3 motif
MVIYVIVCSESLKLYVGQHKHEDRLKQYLASKFWDAHRATTQRSHLYNAMRKHPRGSWSIYPLVSGVETRTKLDELEKYFIRVFKAQHPDTGYNICDGGEGRTAPMTEAQRLQLSARMKKDWASGKFQEHGAKLKKRWESGEFQGIRGTPHTDEWKNQASIRGRQFRHAAGAKEKIRQALMGHEVSNKVRSHARDLGKKQVGDKNPFFGRHHSNESREANAAAHRGRKASEETKRKMSQAQKARQTQQKVA